MSIMRGSVLGLGLCLVLVGTIEAQAQGNRENTSTTTTYEFDGGLSALRTYVMTLVAQIEQSKGKIAQLEAALNAEISARQAADVVLQNQINAISGGGVTQAYVDAAVALERTERSTADAALEGQIANEAAARAAADALLAPLTALEPFAALMPLAPLASYVSINTGTINDLAGPHIIFTGANVHVRSGHASGDSLVQNGRGNLILGYNESGGYVPAERGGSHNVVAGPFHRYNFGVGLVFGYASRLGGDGASVSGGFMNQAAGEFSSVSGGSINSATGMFAAVSGGDSNTAIGANSAVNGGSANDATGDFSAVSGGRDNTASLPYSVVP
jgi:hypothetical protein